MDYVGDTQSEERIKIRKDVWHYGKDQLGGDKASPDKMIEQLRKAQDDAVRKGYSNLQLYMRYESDYNSCEPAEPYAVMQLTGERIESQAEYNARQKANHDRAESHRVGLLRDYERLAALHQSGYLTNPTPKPKQIKDEPQYS